MRSILIGLVVCVCGLLLLPAPAGAQGGGSISGQVTDATGGVLPGVTATAASPALIEGVITAVTDGAGRFTIINLRPGDYTVTFTLVGFGTVVREGIQLAGDATANVSVALTVGALEESVTVTGTSPLVDVQQVRRQAVISRELLTNLPNPRTLEARALLVPGVRNTGLGAGQGRPTVHGSETGDALTYNDGMRTNNTMETGGGGYRNGWRLNDAATAELTFETGGAAAETQVGGMIVNVVPKEGGNTFSGTAFTYFGNQSLQGDNITAELIDQIRVANKLDYDFDINPALGGPILQDKLWFFGSWRMEKRKELIADSFFAPAGTTSKSGADITFGHAGEQSFRQNHFMTGLVRLTHQVNTQNKWRISFDKYEADYPFFNPSPLVPPETTSVPPSKGHSAQVRWTSSVSSRMLIEFGASEIYAHWQHIPQPGMYTSIPTVELTTGLNGGSTIIRGGQPDQRYVTRSSVSYVTGSHNFKVGLDNTWAHLTQATDYYKDTRQLRFNGGVPFQVNVTAAPLGNFGANIDMDMGLYAQDQWTFDRWTLNLGARYDYFSSTMPAVEAPAGVWVGARSIPQIDGPKWHTLSPRLGVVYDVFGDGKTALKANFNKYIAAENTSIALQLSPVCCTSIYPHNERRSWTDLNGDRTIVGVDGRVQYEEVGPSPTGAGFGLATDITQLDPNLKRDGHYEYGVSVQHELRPGLSITGGVYRRDYTNLFFTDDRAVGPNDYTPFTITGASDPRLPNGGGEQITMYNLNPDKFGIGRDRFLTNSNINDRVYTGFEVVVDARLGNGGIIGGSMTTEKLQINSCQVDNPNDLRHCDSPLNFRTMAKIHASYPLPYDVLISGFLQAMPAPDIDANTRQTTLPDGSSLTGGGRINYDLIAPETEFLPFQTQLDVRAAKRFTIGATQLTALVDVFNIFNGHTTLGWNNSFGSSWQRVNRIMRPRFARLGLEVNW
jgi:hypothetical protein